ncbi:hypothetical protein [Lichenibacterium dinghuense]|uniref:hypothetical protein n=1 Tax=Lichenibacterium dinghuense TaxID=2895977 RepID=UPI001F2498ED|nr:hypothetical protein [Lichenibacterium sp. 6Y81]
MSNISIKTLSSKTKAMWAILTVAGSVIAAVISTTTYINGLIADITSLKKQVADISEQIKPLKDQLEDVRNLKSQVSAINDELRPVNGRVRTNVDYNGSGFAACDPGSFLTGLSISVNDHLNSHGQIECSRVQPIGR